MDQPPPTHATVRRELLSKITRFEALFELMNAVNAASGIEAVGHLVARRLKYIADVASWRYICFDGTELKPTPETRAIVVDGSRGTAKVARVVPSDLSGPELDLWADRRPRILCGDDLSAIRDQLPPHLQKGDLEQISANVLVEDGRTRALFLFGKRRSPFTELDLKYLTMMCGFVHQKIHRSWEQQKLRDLELAYLQQELMLRETEKLATLGRLSAGLAHELNNPASAASRGVEQAEAAVVALTTAQVELTHSGLGADGWEALQMLGERATARDRESAGALDPLAQSDREDELEGWLQDRNVDAAWEHAPVLVSMGLEVEELDGLSPQVPQALFPQAISYLCARFTLAMLHQQIGRGTRRVADVVAALKGYSYMDQAPVQSVDVRAGLRDTLAMLQPTIGEDVRVEVEFGDELPALEGRGSELNQVWTHLIDNAIWAMRDGGALRVEALRDGDRVVVRVGDTGPGIPDGNQRKVFDPFFTTKPPGEGAGLGLTIAHAIVEGHGGSISFDSRPGDTCFEVALPLSPGRTDRSRNEQGRVEEDHEA